MNNHPAEKVLGFIFLLAILMVGKVYLSSELLFFRLMAGLGLGYALTRGAMGFAGSVNRAYNTGSTKLMRILMFMFVATAIFSIGFLYQGPEKFDLWINPINLGLILGGLLFGFGMTFSSCCASGVLTDIVTGLPRALVTLIFFSLGVFVGFPWQGSKNWITDSWFTSATGKNFYGGVYLPDLFAYDGFHGYLGASLITVLFAAIVIYLSHRYEINRRKSHSFFGVGSEIEQYQVDESSQKPYNLFSKEGYDRIFVKPWTMEMAAMVITGIFLLLMGVTGAGWGASTPYGFWFGRVLLEFGIPLESITAFTGKPDTPFIMPFFEHPIYVQNVGIILGTFICLLIAGKFAKAFTCELKINFKSIILFAIGGFCMGIGTRFANGCNVGSLYTPIANFSLSGWVFLIFLVSGGIAGNFVAKRVR